MADPVKQKVRKASDGSHHWFCIACGRAHGGPSNRWAFNGDFDKPTFSPSFLIRSGHYIPGHTGACWCTYNAQHPDDPSGFACLVCHTFVRDGKIDYLADCTHGYAGQTLDMVAF